MEAFMAWLKSVNDVVWGPGMLVLLVGTGLYLTVGLKFFTFRNFFRGLKNLWAGRSNQSEQGEISPFNALMTALAADITEVLIRHLNSKESAVSVALTQVEPDAWQAVWDSEIAPQMAQLIKKPGYSM